MTTARRQFDVFVLRYVPTVLEGRFINLGVLLLERVGEELADCRFRHDWDQVRSFDPDADVEMLAFLTREIENGWKRPSERDALLQQMLEFSSGVQLSPGEMIVTDDPAEELERLIGFC